MRAMTKFGLVCMCAASLLACSKPAPVVVGDNSVGPITVATPFDVAAVAKLLPSFTVAAAVSAEMQPGEHVIRVSQRNKPLFELYPDRTGKTVESVLVLGQSIKDKKGVHLGSTFMEALPSADTSACSLGQGEKAGRLFCPQAGSIHVFYQLQGDPPAANGVIPDTDTLKTWKVTAMLWDGSEPAP